MKKALWLIVVVLAFAIIDHSVIGERSYKGKNNNGICSDQSLFTALLTLEQQYVFSPKELFRKLYVSLQRFRDSSLLELEKINFAYFPLVPNERKNFTWRKFSSSTINFTALLKSFEKGEIRILV